MRALFYKFNSKYYFETDKHEGEIVLGTGEHYSQPFRYVSHLELDYDLDDEEYDALMEHMDKNLHEIINAKEL